MQEITVTTPGVFKQLENLKENKACGPDNISPHVLKACAAEIAPMLTVIFNQSLSSGIVPEDWVDANVVPLHKKGQQDLVDNYRPVSLTCIISKVMEHIIYSAIARHLESNSILTPSQHGFRPGHSCETQLILAFNDWARAADSRIDVDVAILDFSKAFDSVPHERLKAKLHYYGIRGQVLHWIDAFLGNRRQRVFLNGSCSDWAQVVSGVPQGSVLGPLLFLLYINDIGEGIQSTIRLFADDCVLYREIRGRNDSYIFQKDLNHLDSWSEKWQMKFNVKKCCVMHISNKRKKIINKYSMAGTPLLHVSNHPYLGIEMQDNLHWDRHITNIVNKASRTLGMIRRNLWGVTFQTKSLAYLSLVRPQLEYASVVWDPHSDKHCHKLDMVQRRSARFVMGDYRNTSSVSDMMVKMQWPELTERRRIARLSMLFKASTNKICLPLHDLKRPTRFTRNASQNSFIPIGTHGDIYKYSFFPRTVVDWNSLSCAIKSSVSVDSFKIALSRNHLV